MLDNGEIIAIATLLVTVVIGLGTLWWSIRKSRKKLSYIVLRNSKLVDLGEVFSDGIRLSFNGSSAKDLFQLVIQITNSGNQPITKEDYEMSLTLEYELTSSGSLRLFQSSRNKPFVHVSCTEKSAESMECKFQLEQISEGKIKIVVEPMLLNPKDFFSLQLLSSEEFATPKFLTRISGISRVNEKELKRPFYPGVVRIIIWYVVISTVMFFLLLSSSLLGGSTQSLHQLFSLFLHAFLLFGYIPLGLAFLFTFMDWQFDIN